jgi:integrase
MGKWRRFEVGQYRLGQLNGRAVAVWRDDKKRRIRLSNPDGSEARTEEEGRAALHRYARRRTVLEAEQSKTVGDLFKLYMTDRETDGKLMPAFRDNWRALAPHFGGMAPEHVTADECRAYARNRLETVSQGTVWTELTRLRSCINWAIKRRVIQPAGYVWVLSKPPPKQRVLTVEEAKALIDAAVTPHVKLFIWIALLTGARSGAILSLEWSRVSFDEGTIDFKVMDQPNPLQKRARKTAAKVSMTPELRFLLLEAKAGALTDHVIEWDAAPVASIRKGFSEACRRAGLTDVVPHTLRHTHATLALESGVEIERISRQLGHRDSATTRGIYLHPSADYSAPAAQAVAGRLKVVKG